MCKKSLRCKNTPQELKPQQCLCGVKIRLSRFREIQTVKVFIGLTPVSNIIIRLNSCCYSFLSNIFINQVYICHCVSLSKNVCETLPGAYIIKLITAIIYNHMTVNICLCYKTDYGRNLRKTYCCYSRIFSVTIFPYLWPNDLSYGKNCLYNIGPRTKHQGPYSQKSYANLAKIL